MAKCHVYNFVFVFLSVFSMVNSAIPIVVSTWNFAIATEQAWKSLATDNDAINALTIGCETCEIQQCDHTVGYGGSPDENGETTLDAQIFDGKTMDMGAVGNLRRIKNAIRVARNVLQYTKHSLMVGELSTEFAVKFNYDQETLSTNFSKNLWQTWIKDGCKPNFWKTGVHPPPPKPKCNNINNEIEIDKCILKNNDYYRYNQNNHDTIGMIVINKDGHIVAGTSTNGASFKIPGRVGDSPIPGAGAYADNEAGASVSTGDGDVMMRFLPSFLAVEKMREGCTPLEAAQKAVRRIADKYLKFFGAVIAVNRHGEFGAACNGMREFPFTLLAGPGPNPKVQTHTINCTNFSL